MDEGLLLLLLLLYVLVLLHLIWHHRPKFSTIVPDCIPTMQFEQLTALLSFRHESQNIKTCPERKKAKIVRVRQKRNKNTKQKIRQVIKESKIAK